ncbi:MAG TPA: tRNA pseudouridine(55) synthase TruB [Candidatus Omnitrophota bacterium]|nr:tRNA pseudouridine(55) synthase TruB [Candidatus Omnitrophota bacterium]
MIEGIVVVNKPPGITSHDVVSFVRRKFKMRRVGHAGTLDPMATGVLVVLLGKSTKLFDRFVAFDKAYRATLTLGMTTTTADIQGEVTGRLPYDQVSSDQVKEVFKRFVGQIQQIPPMVSAVKQNGERLYKLARRGLNIERTPRNIRIDSLQLVDFLTPEVKFYVECSKGTYVRQLAQDVGEVLGCGACISQIERTKVGPFVLPEAVTLEELNESHIRRWSGQT